MKTKQRCHKVFQQLCQSLEQGCQGHTLEELSVILEDKLRWCLICPGCTIKLTWLQYGSQHWPSLLCMWAAKGGCRTHESCDFPGSQNADHICKGFSKYPKFIIIIYYLLSLTFWHQTYQYVCLQCLRQLYIPRYFQFCCKSHLHVANSNEWDLQCFFFLSLKYVNIKSSRETRLKLFLFTSYLVTMKEQPNQYVFFLRISVREHSPFLPISILHEVRKDEHSPRGHHV